MLSSIITGALLIFSLVIQMHPSFDVLKIAGVKPDILFVIIVYMGYSFGSFKGEVAGFIGGVLQDSVSTGPLGLLTFPKVAVGILIGLFGREIIKSTILSVTLMVFLASLIKGIITLFLCYIFHQAQAEQIYKIILPEAFYNAILSPILFIILDKIFENDLDNEARL
jgi:rod shape-determining protein MreD